MYLRISCFSLIVDALLNDDTLFVVDFLCAADVAVFVLVVDNFFFYSAAFLTFEHFDRG